MIDKLKLESVVASALEGTEYFPVTIAVTPDNRLTVEIDSPNNVDIDFCVDLTRKIEAEFDRDIEDYELEVGSAGITTPLKVDGQYAKNIGRKVEVVASDGKKHRGMLKSASPDEFVLVESVKTRKEGSKKPVIEDVDVTYRKADCKYVVPVLEF